MKRFKDHPERHPRWKGGHKYWQKGKHGRDKDGLSWSVQRRLAWKRDGYKCQYLGCTLGDEQHKPNVHHKVPYRISFSHALSNLICYCRSHHKQAEALIKELWGGKTFGGGPRPHKPIPLHLLCGICKKRRRLFEGLCWECYKLEKLLPRIKEFKQQGLSYDEIGKKLGISYQSAWNWLHSKFVPVDQ